MARTKAPTYARRIQSLANKLAELRGRGSPRRFLPPIGDSELSEIETKIGAPLPDEVRAFYREVAGGERRTDVPAILDFEQAQAAMPLALGEPFPFADADADALIAANQSLPSGGAAIARPGPCTASCQ